MDVREAQKIATLARLELTAAEEPRFAAQLTAILGYFKKLEAVATDGVPPASHPAGMRSPLRPDAIEPFPDPARLVQASAGAEGEFFRVPRVLE